MNISILSVFPELYTDFLKTSLMRRAQENNILAYDVDSFFSFVAPKERIDAPTFGHGSGMLIKPEVIEKAIAAKEASHGDAFKIFFSPQGKKLDQRLLQKIRTEMGEKKHLMLVASRYEGMDTRVEETYADMVISIGDFVVMGGDIPAMLFLEGFCRLLPGVVGKQDSLEHESFSGPFLDYPEYTAPLRWHDQEVPEIIRSGNHAAMNEWRERKAAKKTVLQHFDWLRSSSLNEKQKVLAQEFIPPHYCALMHTDVMLPNQQPGTTSVTSIDIHDIARSAKTYGLKNYFVVTPLYDQQKIVQTLLDFWHTGYGIEYNKQRHEAVRNVQLAPNLNEVIEAIERIEGIKPVVIATSARPVHAAQVITYYDQDRVWELNRPVLFIFGTGKGLAQEVIEGCDFLLVPLNGFSEFNHLSVRSAVAIVFDRWLGINPKTEN